MLKITRENKNKTVNCTFDKNINMCQKIDKIRQ